MDLDNLENCNIDEVNNKLEELNELITRYENLEDYKPTKIFNEIIDLQSELAERLYKIEYSMEYCERSNQEIDMEYELSVCEMLVKDKAQKIYTLKERIEKLEEKEN